MKPEVLILTAFTLGFLVGCAPRVPEFSSEDPSFKEMALWADGAADPRERAGRLFLLADAAYKAGESLKSSDIPEERKGDLPRYRETAKGALLRIVELGLGPVEEARHNLALLFQEEDSSPGDAGKEDPPPGTDQTEDPSTTDQEKQDSDAEPRDLSSLVRTRSEEDKNMEEILEMEQKRRTSREIQKTGSPVPPSEDW